MPQYSNTSSLEKDISALPRFDPDAVDNDMHGTWKPRDADETSQTALRPSRTERDKISISPELFEKMYLNPQTSVPGNLRKTFGNPTPIALIGFILTVTPMACEMMGWRNAAAGPGPSLAVNVGACFFMGGLLMFTGGILEFFLANTFSFAVFVSYGGYFFSYGITLTPSYNAYNGYNPDPVTTAQGLASAPYNAGFGFFLLCMALLSLIFLICSLRTNIMFVIVFLTLVVGFILEAGEYFQIGVGNPSAAASLRVSAGVSYFISVAAGWYVLFAQMLASLDFPFAVPVGDISMLIKPMGYRRDKAKGKEAV